jgi:competence protein ComEA
VGPSTADKIIAYREKYPFRSIVQLKRIKGIGPKRYEAMRPYLAVEGENTLRVASP